MIVAGIISMAPLIGIYNVEKSFGDKVVLKNVRIEINKGEIFGIVGASGCGKTTLLKVIMGFYRPNEGTIEYNSKNVTGNTSALSKFFGFSAQDNCYYEDLTVSENLMYYGRLYGIPKKKLKERIDRLLANFSLTDSKKVVAKKLSGGMGRRLDLACAIIHEPEVLILDEPTEGLDPVLRKNMWNIIKQINKNGTTIIVASHLLDEVEILCQRVAILRNGAAETIVSTERLKSYKFKAQKIAIETLPGNYGTIINELVKAKAPVNYAVAREGRLIVYTQNPQLFLQIQSSTLSKIGERLLSMEMKGPNLEELFEFMTRKRK